MFTHPLVTLPEHRVVDTALPTAYVLKAILQDGYAVRVHNVRPRLTAALNPADELEDRSRMYTGSYDYGLLYCLLNKYGVDYVREVGLLA